MKMLAALRGSALSAALLMLLPVQARAGSVTGRVLDFSGKPLAGARVQWTAYRTDDEVLLDQTTGNEPAVLGSAATDAAATDRSQNGGAGGGPVLPAWAVNPNRLL